MDVEEFDGCKRTCRIAGHSLAWGECAKAPESARPEPRLTVLRVRTMEDDQPGLVGESLTVTELAARVEKALRTIPVRLGPNALAMLMRGETVGLSGGEYWAMALAVAVDLIEEAR